MAQKKYFEMQDEQNKDREIFIQSYTDTVIEMELFMDHLSFECQKIDAIMNYHQILYRRVKSNICFHICNNYWKESKYCLFVWIQK